MKESATTSHVRLEAARLNVFLFRNNSGAWKDAVGRVIWYGLGSFKKKDNFKSGDYVGITPVLITPDMVGAVIGVFTNIEMKESDWNDCIECNSSLHISPYTN
jgi:hypothetical protein